MNVSVANSGIHVNDVHSRLNPCWVRQIRQPENLESLLQIVNDATEAGMHISVAGARHAMGGQQFGASAILCDTTRLNRLLSLDADRGIAEIEAGATWPEVVSALHGRQSEIRTPWTIIQKQTGADRLSLGGAVSANIHGRGLAMRPFVDNIEAVTLVTPSGEVATCSREQNRELFSLAVGGYGLFGIVYSVTLRLARRKKMRRIVEITTVEKVMDRFKERIQYGCTFGDFQYLTDDASPEFLSKGVLACYVEEPEDTPIPEQQYELTGDQWHNLIYLAHTDKARAYDLYASHYRSTDGQIYWSDAMQMSTYLDDYHERYDAHCGAQVRGSEMITELYVPRESLPDFMRLCADDFRKHSVNVIYGTVRLIERDVDTFLPWAREPWACVIFNLHVDHTPSGILHAADAFRRLIDWATHFRGTYYLTYHRFATPEQLSACYSQFDAFTEMKRLYDPNQVFRSDWFRHYADTGLSS